MAIRILVLCISILLLSSSCNEKARHEDAGGEVSVTEKPNEATNSPVNKADPSKKTPSIAEIVEKAPPMTKQELLGRRMFITCSACHSLKKGEAHKVGPNLHGFLGSKAAAKEDYTYSEALISAGIVWSDNTLKEWLGNPAGYVPGTKMAFIGIEDEEKQDALIAYLKRETK